MRSKDKGYGGGILKKRGHRFPADFLWGVSTASYQIEGGVHEGGRGETIWDRFCHIPGKMTNADTGDIACGSYYRTQEDVEILKDLGVKAYRFSIAWARIIPDGFGAVSEEGLAYYEELVDTLLENGIEPFVTLYHWDLPQKVQDRGGWTNRETAFAFTKMCRILFERFGEKVKHYITINEPWVVCFEGYYTGNMAPGLTDFSAALQAAHHILFAHGLTVEAYRNTGLAGEIGITLNLCPKEPLTRSEADREAAMRFDGYANRWFLDPLFKCCYPQDLADWYKNRGVVLPYAEDGDMEVISREIDFLGVNYYNIDFTAAAEGPWPLEFRTGFFGGYPTTHYGWPVTPHGIRLILTRISEDYHPKKLYITENGASYTDRMGEDGRIRDDERITYIERHLEECANALRCGVPLAGYFVWSFMDNFEWNTGFENKFGLVHVDRATLVRTRKSSFYWYRDMIGRGL